jgi:hypothetical protein
LLWHGATPQGLFCTSHKHPLSAPDATFFLSALCCGFPLFLKEKVKANFPPFNGVDSFAKVHLESEVFWMGAAQQGPVHRLRMQKKIDR